MKPMIRKAILSDVNTIIRFQLLMARETENLELDESTVRLGVNSVFSDAGKGQYFVSEVNQQVVGSLLITYEWSDWRNSKVIWIQSVYVEKEYRNKGLFRLLFDHIKSMVEENQEFSGIRLYVDISNHNAIAVYRSIGMSDEHYATFEWMKGF